MGVSDFLKAGQEDDFAVSVFQCKRGSLAVRGMEYRPDGDGLPVAIVCHGFGKKHDAIAMAQLRRFAERGKL